MVIAKLRVGSAKIGDKMQMKIRMIKEMGFIFLIG
jgi:hypothetical protein